MSVKVSCPSCGGPITFKIGSAMVLVCPYCRSVVARGDRQLDNLGKVAELVETDSLLSVGFRGRYQGVPFELTGRTQLGHEAGGVWDEWYAAFTDNRWGWLAEAQGRFYLTFKSENPAAVPSFEELALGQGVHPARGAPVLLVAEKGEARPVSAEGEIPYLLVPGSTYSYADLSGPQGEFGTLDYGETPPLVFLGREVTPEEIGIPATARPAEHEARQVEGVQLSCPQCGGALELRAPDKTERVTCPNCGSLLDVNQGQLRFLKALEPSRVRPIIPLGSLGSLRDHSLMVIGFLLRSVRIEGTKYYWEEYLLYHVQVGFRWLVRSDHHWSYVHSIPPGQVVGGTRIVLWHQKTFRIFQRARATVEHVLGEFYWKVSVGEQVDTIDYVCPPEMLSREVTKGSEEGTGEINWSLGTYLPVADVEKAFGLKSLPQPSFANVAPNQPFLHKRLYLYWAVLSAAAIMLGIMVFTIAAHRKVYEQTFQVQESTNPEQPQVLFSEPFDLQGHQNIHVRVHANVDNSWLEVEGDLINEETGLVQPFSAEVEHYHGIDQGEAWSEGSTEASVYLSAVPAGKYSLRLELVPGHWQAQQPNAMPPPPNAPAKPPPVTGTIRIEQGVPHVLTLFLTLLALAVIPALVLAYHFFFEISRWRESSYSPFHTS